MKQWFAHYALAVRYAVLEWLSVKTLLLCQIDASLVVMKGCACLVLVIVLHHIFFDGGCHQSVVVLLLLWQASPKCAESVALGSLWSQIDTWGLTGWLISADFLLLPNLGLMCRIHTQLLSLGRKKEKRIDF